MKNIFNISPKNVESEAIYFSWQKVYGNFIATNSGDSCVQIHSKRGEIVEEVNMPGVCTGFGWMKDGSVLSLINNKNGIIWLWNASKQDITFVESGFRDKDTLTFLLWSKTTQHLAVGTLKGNLLLYNHQTIKKIPILGKHTKRITSGAWNRENFLALGGEDKALTISNVEGDTVSCVGVEGEIRDVQFSTMKRDERADGENTVSLIKNRKTLYLYDIADSHAPLEIKFKEAYGDIVSYNWHGDGYIIMGFSNGYFIIVSSHYKEIGQEICQVRDYRNYMSYLCVSSSINIIATAGDDCVKLHETNDPKQTTTIIQLSTTTTTTTNNNNHVTKLDRLKWSDDGQLLAITSTSPSPRVHVYLASMPVLGGCWRTRVAYLTSLREVTVEERVEGDHPRSYMVDIEPTFIGLGPCHLVVGMNNRAWFYAFRGTDLLKLEEKEYLSTIQSMKLNKQFASALCDGKVVLSMIENHDDNEDGDDHSNDNNIKLNGNINSRDMMTFPQQQQQQQQQQQLKITSHFLMDEFLIYTTDKGTVNYFHLADWCPILEYHHICQVTRGQPDGWGGRVVLVDGKGDCLLYHAPSDNVLPIPDTPQKVVGSLWDEWPIDKNIFIVYDHENVYTYCLMRETLKGPQVIQSGVTRLPYNHQPIILHAGNLTLLTPSGSTTNLYLTSHPVYSYGSGYGGSGYGGYSGGGGGGGGGRGKRNSSIEFDGEVGGGGGGGGGYGGNGDGEKRHVKFEELKLNFKKSLSLARYSEAYQVCQLINIHEFWEELARCAISSLDVETAMKAYQADGDVGRAMALQKLLLMEDKNLLSGYLCMLIGDFDSAQELFLNSVRPIAALEMRRDLMHWDQALELSRRLAQGEMPFISNEYAHQLEFVGEYGESLKHYQQGITKDPNLKDHDEACMAGIARMMIRNGEINKGMTLALKLGSKTVLKDCAVILESMKQYIESGSLYEKACLYDKAATVYIKAKNWTKVGEIRPNVTSTKVHSQYARAREMGGGYKEAGRAYEDAKDWGNAVRIYLDHLKNPDEAIRVVKMSNSLEGAKMVSKFFESLKDYSTAIQFLVLSKCNDDAFRLAQKHGHMAKYADIIGDDAKQDDYKSIAVHFENEGSHYLAGKFYFLAGYYTKSINHLLDPSNNHNEEAINLAVDVAGQSNDQQIFKRLIGYLMGDVDQEPKDPKFLFRLYMVQKKYKEASSIAIIIAREEQNNGSYRSAHTLLFDMFNELRKQNMKAPYEMYHNLMLLHSYILVKILVKMGDHLKAARMLIRVANNISKFPSHVVPILTSTVIECQRSGLKVSAFTQASYLMRPENREKLDPKYRKKIEAIVRKPEKIELEPELSECPYCGFNLSETELTCTACKNNLPFCIASGRHVVKDHTTVCPSCNFPAIIEEFLSLLKSEESACPMCGTKVDPLSIQKPVDIKKILKSLEMD